MLYGSTPIVGADRDPARGSRDPGRGFLGSSNPRGSSAFEGHRIGCQSADREGAFTGVGSPDQSARIDQEEANAPPADALAARGLAANVVGYPVYGDYSTESPLSPIVAAVARGDIDVAAVWGPAAGWLAQRQPVTLAVVPIVLSPAETSYQLAFDIAMGVRKGDDDLRRELDGVIASHTRAIERILARYSVPLALAGVPSRPQH